MLSASENVITEWCAQIHPVFTNFLMPNKCCLGFCIQTDSDIQWLIYPATGTGTICKWSAHEPWAYVGLDQMGSVGNICNMPPSRFVWQLEPGHPHSYSFRKVVVKPQRVWRRSCCGISCVVAVLDINGHLFLFFNNLILSLWVSLAKSVSTLEMSKADGYSESCWGIGE